VPPEAPSFLHPARLLLPPDWPAPIPFLRKEPGILRDALSKAMMRTSCTQFIKVGPFVHP
jgi:hypothetical protein